MTEQYWLTPSELYRRLDDRHHFTFDPCPYPLPPDFNGLKMEWGESNFVNPPTRKTDCYAGSGPTAFVRKAIHEREEHGRKSVILLPVPSYVNLLTEAGAKLLPLGRVQWLEVDTREPLRAAYHVCGFILE